MSNFDNGQPRDRSGRFAGHQAGEASIGLPATPASQQPERFPPDRVEVTPANLDLVLRDAEGARRSDLSPAQLTRFSDPSVSASPVRLALAANRSPGVAWWVRGDPSATVRAVSGRTCGESAQDGAAMAVSRLLFG